MITWRRHRPHRNRRAETGSACPSSQMRRRRTPPLAGYSPCIRARHDVRHGVDAELAGWARRRACPQLWQASGDLPRWPLPYLLPSRHRQDRMRSRASPPEGRPHMLPRLAWAGSGRGDRPGQSPPRPGAIAPKWVPPASIRGSAPPATHSQKQAVRMELASKVLVITGGPGVGQDDAVELHPEDPDGQADPGCALRTHGPGRQAPVGKHRSRGQDDPSPAGDRPCEGRLPPGRIESPSASCWWWTRPAWWTCC